MLKKMPKLEAKKIKVEVDVKPLSVNKVWQGRRYKTRDYLNYEKELLFTLPKRKTITGNFEIEFTFYLKNPYRQDLDNFIKPLLDILVKKGYIEDDRKMIYLKAKKIKADKDKISIKIKDAN